MRISLCLSLPHSLSLSFSLFLSLSPSLPLQLSFSHTEFLSVSLGGPLQDAVTLAEESAMTYLKEYAPAKQALADILHLRSTLVKLHDVLSRWVGGWVGG